MTDKLRLRPAQQSVLAYAGGRMAVSAVPGSGKTFTLSLLAARLIADRRIDAAAGQQVLIVTYQNASVDNFRARIRQHLIELGLPETGFDVRTLHSLALEIIRASGENAQEQFIVLDDVQARMMLNNAVDGWINDNQAHWSSFLPNDRPASPQEKTRWRAATESMTAALIRTAKNERYRPHEILRELGEHDTRRDPFNPDEPQFGLLRMVTAIYARYQAALERTGSLDFDDLIWRATDLLDQRQDLTLTLRARWPYVLEDESQDSVPLQELLLESLTGPDGNWVRVGDPNQAITSTFTAAHPRHFNAFIDRPDVVALTLPNSGRSAELIIGAANTLLNWTLDQHPVDEVRATAFRRLNILPAPPGDTQPNPPDSEASLRIRVFPSRDEGEVPAIASDAWAYAQRHPEHTVAILAPTHQFGHKIAVQLDELGAAYDNLLRGSGRERMVAALIQSILALLANPLDNKALLEAHNGLLDLDGPGQPHSSVSMPLEDAGHFRAVLRSVQQPEDLLFAAADGPDDLAAAFPPGTATERELEHLWYFTGFLQRLFMLRDLPVDDMTLALADELFTGTGNPDGDDSSHEMDLAIAYQIAGQLRQWWESQPDLRLPELVAQLGQVATGQRSLNMGRPEVIEPQPGRITLMTQHGSKGLEWDCVYLVGIDGYHIPATLDSQFQGMSPILGEDPQAEATSQLRYLMQGQAGLFPGRSATESAHIEVINERLRLLYVGITRARRSLTISRSVKVSNKENKETAPATAVGAIYRYLKSRHAAEDDQSPDNQDAAEALD